MTEQELVTLVTDVANKVIDEKGYFEHVHEWQTEMIIKSIRFINKTNEAMKQVEKSKAG
jgi:hypothetical protein